MRVQPRASKGITDLILSVFLELERVAHSPSKKINEGKAMNSNFENSSPHSVNLFRNTFLGYS